METQWLRWIRKNQKIIHSELYQGSQDACPNYAWGTSGSAITLPVTVTGSPRFIFMHQNFQDALALCSQIGKPHLFITGLTNPDWPECKAQLKPGQTVNDRPDIANHPIMYSIEDEKYEKMIENGLFFVTKARCYFIEWQKCGLMLFPLIIWFDLPPIFQIN
jgi:hypothetical protein